MSFVASYNDRSTGVPPAKTPQFYRWGELRPRAAVFKVAAAISGLLLVLASFPARADTPLYDEDPYDQVTLNAANNSEVLKIRPLDASIRRAILAGRPPLKLVVCRVAESDKEYEVLWRNIVKVEFFDQMVLNKASELVQEGRFEDAYDYFTFLQRNRPGTPGLAKANEDFLFAEANASYHKGQYDSALALLREIYRRNPKRPKLDRVLAATTNKLIEQYVSEQDYAAARILLHNLAVAYPDNPVVAKWNGQWRTEATALLIEARAAAEGNQWGKAAELSRRLTTICPELPGARELAEAVHHKCSRVVVGVTSTATDLATCRLDDWASRRMRRLVYRTLTEFGGPGSEGGKYSCPLGQISVKGVSRKLTVSLRPDIHWASGTATLTGVDLARVLLSTATPGTPTYQPDWANLMGSIAVRGVYGVEAELRRNHVHPEAMLQVIVTPPGATPGPGHQPLGNGPFTASGGSRDASFGANPQYFATEPGQPMELVERRFDNTARAINALKRGEIQVVDRINPWALPSLRSDARLTVQSYAMPLVHCLIPNSRRPILNDRNYRRALAYGINRQAILQQMLSNNDIPGCVVTSSPFPLGIGAGDPMGYASDETIEPRPYDPRLCIALANMSYEKYLAARTAAKAGAQPEEKKAERPAEQAHPKPETKRAKNRTLPPLPKLTLAYPPDEIARAACLAIQKQLDCLGIPIELRPLKDPLPQHVPNDVDLLYVELAAWEPVVDANRLFGEGGVVSDSGPYMSLALRQLDQAVEWEQVRDCLHRLHRIAYDDVTVIPLWQLVDHFAYRKTLRGVATQPPVTLYQNVEQWRAPFQYPVEK